MTPRPDFLLSSPDFARAQLACRKTGADIKAMDPLSDVLRAVRLTGAYFFMVEARHPWTASAVAAAQLAPRVLPGAEHLISYHIVMSGTCWGGLGGGEQVVLEAGDAILFPQGDPHVISSVEVHGRQPAHPFLPDRYPATVRVGDGAGPQALLVCGFLGCDLRPYNPLIAALPRVLHARGIARAGGWLSEFPRQVVAESRAGGTGSETMLTRMAELMFA